jgi:hypothetical protein
MKKFSYELCGGTHVAETGDIGLFLITSEGSVAAGIRRIEAVTGRGAYELVQRRFRALHQAAGMLATTPEGVPDKVTSLQADLSAARKQIASLRQNLASAELTGQLETAQEVKGVHVLTATLPGADIEALRQMVDRFRQRYPQSSVAVLASVSDGRPTLIAAVTEDLVSRGLNAGELVKFVASPLGGGGGGRPTLAQAGGKDASRLEEALSSVAGWVEEHYKLKICTSNLDGPLACWLCGLSSLLAPCWAFQDDWRRSVPPARPVRVSGCVQRRPAAARLAVQADHCSHRALHPGLADLRPVYPLGLLPGPVGDPARDLAPEHPAGHLGGLLIRGLPRLHPAPHRRHLQPCLDYPVGFLPVHLDNDPLGQSGGFKANTGIYPYSWPLSVMAPPLPCSEIEYFFGLGCFALCYGRRWATSVRWSAHLRNHLRWLPYLGVIVVFSIDVSRLNS